ncbi:unnamed protein product [Diamesa tonsa]
MAVREPVNEKEILSQMEESPLMLEDFSDKMLDDIDELYKTIPLNDDTTCGVGFIRGRFMQKFFANKKAYVLFYGIVGSIFSATYAYFNGTITTLEKRYKIPSKNLGIISVGNDISSLFISAVLAYYGGKGHRPRWIAFGLYTIVAFCMLTALPHFIYGPGDQALSLTTEYGGTKNDEQTLLVLEKEKQKTICRTNVTAGIAECETEEGVFMPQLLLFMGQLVAGIGQSLYYTLGVAYMDDNIKKSKTPALISFSYFLRLLGPAGGYALASYCLKIYISPDLTPVIDNNDPRWLGAWWLGWIILGTFLFGFAFFMMMFPKELPRAAVRRKVALERKKRGLKSLEGDAPTDEIPASVNDMFITFKRLLKNVTFMLNNAASIFYYFGFMPYWIFTPKYIETQYKQSASTSSLVTGTVALVFSAIGVLTSGVVISKFKPRARYLAMWNVFVGAISVIGMISYAYLGCMESENSTIINTPMPFDTTPTCNSACHCDYVKYSPVCGADGNTYISACHAGCRASRVENNTKIFEQCSCISNGTSPSFARLIDDNFTMSTTTENTASRLDYNFESFESFQASAMPGSCPINCQKEFYMFLIVMCFLKFSGATGRASNFLVSVRCVEERDKTVAMGFGLTFMCLFSFIPSPIFFGTLLDATCLVWGKTCSGTGNCWLYDGETLRYWMNFTAAGFVTVGVILDAGVWYFVKNLKIFDEEIKPAELELADKEDEVQMEKPLS